MSQARHAQNLRGRLDGRTDQRTEDVHRWPHHRRRKSDPQTQKRADYLLRLTRDFPIAIVEAKYRTAGEGLQQAKDYAEILDLKFACATNGHDIIEFDFLTGQERVIDAFASPAGLWSRLRAGQGITDDKAAEQLLTPFYQRSGRTPRYYQEIAVNRVIQAILAGDTRILILATTMATDETASTTSTVARSRSRPTWSTKSTRMATSFAS